MSCPVVCTKSGRVKGVNCKLENKDISVYTFRGIPYARPPVGYLRFLPPQPVKPWSYILDATLISNIPTQSMYFEEEVLKMFPIKNYTTGDMTPSEDCLYLSVYAPEITQGRQLPVMVWFYGGGFQYGHEAMYQGTAIAGMNDVIIVVPNYRVSVFGFLALGKSSQCPGNLGLLDQNLALRWVRDNIECFGGDRGNITIFGQSAGGISVDMHMLSSMSRGLFHKAICQSGQALMSVLFATENTRKMIVQSLKDELQIGDNDDADFLKVLREISAKKLMEAVRELDKRKIWFLPVVDGNFLTKSPEKHYEEKDFAQIPCIIGINKTEASGMIPMISCPGFLLGIMEKQIRKALFMPTEDRVLEECKKFYIKNHKDAMRYSRLLAEALHDTMYAVPALITADKRQDANLDTYMYLCAFRLGMHHTSDNDIIQKPDWCICDHMDEIPMIFGFPLLPGELPGRAKYSEEEKVLSRKCMTYFTNFAKYGNPNKGNQQEITWPKYKKDNEGEHIILDHKLSTGKKLREKEFRFWTETIKEIKHT